MKTVEEISKMFGVSRITIYKWIKEGMKTSKEKVIGKRTRTVIDPADVIAYHKTFEK